MLENNTLLTLSSVGILAILYKLIRFIRTKQLRKTYFKNKVVLITGASSGLGKGKKFPYLFSLIIIIT